MSKRIITLAVLGAAFIAGPASATIWQYNGVITTCNVDICNLVPIASGDPVVGSIEIDVGASDSFTLDTDPTGLGGLLDLIDFSFLVGGVIPVDPVAALDGSPPPCGPAGEPNQCDGVIITGGGTTDASGDFASGTMEGDFLGGTLGGLGGEVSICIEPAGCGAYDIGGFAGTLEQYDMLVTVGFGTVFVTEVEGCMDQPGSVDSDCDAVLNTVDNCTNVANADQIDTNSDGIGNICDPDISSEIPPVPANDCSVQFSDLATLKSVFLTNPGSPNWNPDADFDGDDIVAFGDVAIMKAFFLAMPGPAAAPNAASGCVAPVGYAADVQPILLPKCGACHGGNGVGGHDIAIEYNDAFLDADACPGLNIAECALVRIKNGSMPQGAGCTGDPVLDAGNANCLTQAEQDTVEAWIDGGLLP